MSVCLCGVWVPPGPGGCRCDERLSGLGPSHGPELRGGTSRPRGLARSRLTHWWMACRNFLWCFLTLAWSIFFSSFVCL